MPSSPPDGGSSRHSAGLLLRVQRPDGHADAFYVAGGLTIGRTLANTIVLADDAAVDRTHARVEVADDGTARLRCIEPDSSLTVGGDAVRELPLDEGRRFRIGRTEFECVAGRRGPGPDATPSWTACPFCASTDVATVGEAIRQCPACNARVLPARPDPHGREPILLPADYGDYRAGHYVARGGMGLVLKGAREGGTEPVALKVLLPGTIADQRDAELFEREVAMLARVRHPNVVKLLDHGKSGRYNFLAMEWIEGPSLRRVIAEAGRAGKLTDFATAFRWFGQVGKGLAAIHAVGMVHRDLKPSNILIGPDGVARIADLGIAKRIDAAHTSYTTTGHAPGTFEYMAPEQLNAPDTVDGRTDLYALGVTFYELLTGTRPVGAWRPASKVNPTVPKGFDEILGRLLAPRPEQRFEDVYELLSRNIGSRPTPPTVSASTSASEEAETYELLSRNIGSSPSPPTISDSTSASEKAETAARIPQSEMPDHPMHSSETPPLRKTYRWKERPAEKPTDTQKRPPGSKAGATVGASTSRLASPPAVPKVPEKTVSDPPKTGLFSQILGWIIGGIILAVIRSQTAGPKLPPNSPLLRPPLSHTLGPHPNVAPQDRLLQSPPRNPATVPLQPVAPTPSAEEHISRASTMIRKGQSDAAIRECDAAIQLDQGLPIAYSRRGLAFALKKDFPKALADSNRAVQLGPTYPIVYAERGRVYLEKNEFDSALADFDRAIDLDSKLAVAFAYRALARLEKGPYETALADSERAIALDPNLPEAYIARGAIRLIQGQLDAALADCDEAIRREPSYPDAYVVRAMVHIARAEIDPAIADTNKLIELQPEDPAGWLYRGTAQSRKGKYDRAISDLTRAIELDPTLALARNNRGLAFLEKGEHDRSLADFDEAIKLDPNFAAAYSNRGLVYLGKSEPDRALADCNRAIELDPGNAEALFLRGSTYNAKGDPDRAIPDFSESLRLAPSIAMAHNGRGLAYFNKGEHDRAIPDYDEAIRLDPKMAAAYSNRGTAHFDKGDLDPALADFDKAVQLNPNDADGRISRGTIYHLKGQEDQAIADLSRAIQIDPSNGTARNIRGLAYSGKGDQDRAITEFDEAIRRGLQLATAYSNRGLAHLRKRDFDNALIDCDKALELDPTHYEAFLTKGVAFSAKGDLDRAIPEFTQATRFAGTRARAFPARGRCYQSKGMYDEAIADFNEAIQLNPPDAEKYRELLDAAETAKQRSGP